jgi:hypothetical protein
VSPAALFVLACLAAEPSRCERFQVAVEIDLRLPMQCHGAATEWALAHPAWRIRTATCGPWEVGT